MTKLDQRIGKICNDPFRPTVPDRWNPFKQRRYLGNSHDPGFFCKPGSGSANGLSGAAG